MWTNLEGQHVLWDGTIQANNFVGDGSKLTNLPGGGTESDPIWVAASSAYMRTASLATLETDPKWAAGSNALVSSCAASDHTIASAAQVTNICYGTSATPPTASGTTEGSLYIQYTA